MQQFTSEEKDSDSVKVPPWMYKRLGSVEGAPMCVIMPRNVGDLYFYDVT